ncbi:MAG: hypothetical protein HY043_01710 [Verrucomicrobia bacterium]|nr:hypothetical protein [Verrucomicrobiota bacterium]
MKRRWNSTLWTGFLIILFGLLSYIPLFSLFPITRDFPWANLLLLAAGALLLGGGVRRAFKQPQVYRGKIFGSVLAVLSMVGIGLFAYGLLYQARQIPSAASAPRAGEKAPDFSLPDQNGKTITLAGLLASAPGNKVNVRANGVLLIFYRGHW